MDHPTPSGRSLSEVLRISGKRARRRLRVRFGDFEFDSGSRQLRRGAASVGLTPKAFQLLEILLKERPRALSKADLQDALWPSTFVTESSLARLASELRDALADDARNPSFVRTVYGFGYAFCGEAEDMTLAVPRPPRAGARLRWGTQELPLAEGENVLGRGEEAGVRIDSGKISRQHARITVRGDRAVIVDLGSKNGTFVRGQRVQGEVALAEGDEVCLGPVLLIFRGAGSRTTTETDGG